MFKRARWVSIGAALGFGGSLWAQRKVRAAIERYLPEQVAGRVADRTRGIRSDLRDAIAEGRVAMRAREVELRARTGLRPTPTQTPTQTPTSTRTPTSTQTRRARRRQRPTGASPRPTRHLHVVEATAVETPLEAARSEGPKRSPQR